MNKGKKERVTYIDIEDNDLTSYVEYNHVKKNKVDVAELNPGPPYVCNLITPADGKNPSKPEKNDKFPKKTELTKCDGIFDLLVADGQVLVPPGANVPLLE